MDHETLIYDVDAVAAAGIVLSTELKTALQTSLVILKNAERFKKVIFWGRIGGVARDYFIAQGIAENEIKGKKSFYRFVRLRNVTNCQCQPVFVQH